MQAIKCELCGSNKLIKKDGCFQCEYCGTKYTLEEARNLFINGSVQIDGDVRIKDADFIIKSGTLEKYNGESPIVTIPNSVKALGFHCFSGLAVENVTIPDSVTKIERSAFNGCTTLTTLSIPNKMTEIGEYAFFGCTGLTSIIIPNGVRTIGAYAFARCTGLTSISIPDSVTELDLDSFAWCTGLTSVSLPSNIRIPYPTSGICRFCGSKLKNRIFGKPYCTHCGVNYN